MLRNSLVRLVRVQSRPFSISVATRAAGDTGAPRSGGVQSSDAFTKREAASETKFIRDKEMESLKKLRERLKEQREHLNVLEKHISELEGGEDQQQK